MKDSFNARNSSPFPLTHAQGPKPISLPPALAQTGFFTGTIGADTYDGTGGDDDFFMVQGGHDAVNGRNGWDEFFFGNSFEPLDSVVGGKDVDSLYLDGSSYAQGLTISASMLTGVEKIFLATGNDYTLTALDDLVPASQHYPLIVDGSAVDAAHSIHFDGSAETTGGYNVIGSTGSDVVIGGAGSDYLFSVVYFGNGATTGDDHLMGNGGNDLISFGTDFNARDKAEGGAGYDTLAIKGNHPNGVKIGKGVFGFETVTFGANGEPYDFEVMVRDQLVADGEMLEVRGNALSDGHFLSFDGSRELGGAFTFIGSGGNDTFKGSQNADVFEGFDGKDTLTGNGGSDTFRYTNVAHSTGAGFDTIVGFDAAADRLAAGPVDEIEAAVKFGALSLDSFDADMSAAIGRLQMGSHHAVLFKPNFGDFAGHVFLVVDLNGRGGYQAGEDLVVELADPMHLSQLGLEDF